MTIEVISSTERKLTVTIAKADVQAGVADKLKKYSKEAKLPGFRPGKAPHKVVEQMYGGRAYEDSLNDLLNKKFIDELVENKLNPVNEPNFNLDSSEGEEFVFSTKLEVMPEITLGDLSAATVEKVSCELTDADVEKTIDVLRKQRAVYNDAPEGKEAADGDQVTIDFLGTVDGVAFAGGSAENYPFVLGQGRMLPDFENGTRGLKVGESKDVNVAFPADYHAEDLKGKNAVFKITAKEIKIEALPELTAEFIQSIGVASGDANDLRKDIKENLSHEIARRTKGKTRDNALNALAQVTTLDVPYTLVHDEIHHMMKNAEENMTKQGYRKEDLKFTHEMFENDARRMVVLRALVQKFIAENSVTVTDEDVKVLVEDMAKAYEDSVDYVKWFYTDETRVNNAKAMAMEEKVTDMILAKTQVKDVVMSYEDVMKMQ